MKTLVWQGLAAAIGFGMLCASSLAQDASSDEKSAAPKDGVLASQAADQVDDPSDATSEQAKREKVARAQQLANLSSQIRLLNLQLDERKRRLNEEVESNQERLARLREAEARLAQQDRELAAARAPKGEITQNKIDIDLGGKRSPMKDFVDLIQAQVDTPLNIVISRDAVPIMIPAMRLKNVSVQAALNAATEATEGEMNWHFGDDNEVIIVQLDEGYASDTSETIEVVNASDILESVEEASLLSAIEIGLELRQSSKENVTIQLHKETKLLFVKGVEADINVVRQILSELGGKQWPPEGGGGQGGGGVRLGGGQGGGSGGGVF